MTDTTDGQLIDALCGLLPSQFDVLVVKSGARAEFLSPAATPQATRAAEFVRWMQQSAANRTAGQAALDEVRRAIAADPVLDWQQVCYESYRHLRIVGFEDLAKVSLDLEQIFVELDVRA